MDVVRDNRTLTATILFLVLAAITSVITEAVGFPVMAGMVIAYSVVLVAVTVVFVLLPMYLLNYL